jgi:hypothetical protein
VAFSRYENDPRVDNGRLLGTNQSISAVRSAVRSGRLSTTTLVLPESQRLDIIAGQFYGDGRLWWVIAAASDIGWWLQVPAGTRIIVPNSIEAVESLF